MIRWLRHLTKKKVISVLRASFKSTSFTTSALNRKSVNLPNVNYENEGQIMVQVKKKFMWITF